MRLVFASMVLSASVLGGCISQPEPESQGNSSPAPLHYIASAERRGSILDSFAQIAEGMTSAEVESILDRPDEVRDLFEPRIKDANKIGYTYWYFVERQFPDRQAPGDKVVRISFDLDDRVTNVDKWGFE